MTSSWIIYESRVSANHRPTLIFRFWFLFFNKEKKTKKFWKNRENNFWQILMVQRNEECVRVVVRCRPMSEKETAQGHKKVIQIDSKVRSLICPEGFVEEYGFILTLNLFWKKDYFDSGAYFGQPIRFWCIPRHVRWQ